MLLDERRVNDDSSILIVVGREDTGELEAQVRGSRHAWDIRLISADALLKMVALKENSDEEITGQKIRSILRPVEYTRVDGLVDVVFTAASDLETDPDEVTPEPDGAQQDKSTKVYSVTGRQLINEKRTAIIEALSRVVGDEIVKRTRAMYWSADRSNRIACTISKRYENGPGYWYAFHPTWKAFLEEAKTGFFAMGCMGRDDAFCIPISELQPILPFLNVTENEREMYWHIHLQEDEVGDIHLIVPKQDNIPLAKYSVPLN